MSKIRYITIANFRRSYLWNPDSYDGDSSTIVIVTASSRVVHKFLVTKLIILGLKHVLKSTWRIVQTDVVGDVNDGPRLANDFQKQLLLYN